MRLANEKSGSQDHDYRGTPGKTPGDLTIIPRKPRVPSLRRRQSTRQGVVTLGGHDHYLGVRPADQEQPPAGVQAADDRIIPLWLATG
jgi:hypothetical protein